jgi:hypothetical protein
MILKPDDQLATALATSYTGLTEERKQEILATIRATRPQKLDELHSVFTQPGAGLTAPERAFYDAVDDLSGEEPVLEPFVAEEPVQAVPAAPANAASNGRPARRPFTPGQQKEPATNGPTE